MLVYFDNCTWQRPYDNQTDKKVKQDIVAITCLIELRKGGNIRIAASNANEAELSLDKNSKRRNKVLEYVKKNTDIFLPTSYYRSDSDATPQGESKKANEKSLKKWEWSKTAGFKCKKTEDLIEQLVDLDFKHDDAVHLATACEWGVDIFVTVDDDLLDALKKAKNKGKDIEGLFSKVKSRYPGEKLRNTIGKYLSPNEIETSPRTMKVLFPVDALQEVKIKIKNTGVNS